MQHPHATLEKVVEWLEDDAGHADDGGDASDTDSEGDDDGRYAAAAENAPLAERVAAAIGEDVRTAGAYAPRSGGVVGASLPRFSPELRRAVEAAAGPLLTGFGYVESRGFPHAMAPPPPDQCARPAAPGAGPATVNGRKAELLRGRDDKYGRYMTTFRKMHTDGDTRPLPVSKGVAYRLDLKGEPAP